jgi:hypothetical protein
MRRNYQMNRWTPTAVDADKLMSMLGLQLSGLRLTTFITN